MSYREIIDLCIDPVVRWWCCMPYPNHPKGCPNFNKKAQCPPKCPLVGEVLDFNSPLYLVWNEFDFGGHVSRMKSKHPGWSKRQLECCLYWQPKARKALRKKVANFLADCPGNTVFFCPEAMGVNVTVSMEAIGITLEWPPVTKTYQVALAGKPRSE